MCCDSSQGYHELRNATIDDWLSRRVELGEYMRANHMTRVLCGLGATGGKYFWEDAATEVFEPLTTKHLECAKVSVV